MVEYFSTEGGHLKRTPEGMQALRDELEYLIEVNDYLRSLSRLSSAYIDPIKEIK